MLGALFGDDFPEIGRVPLEKGKLPKPCEQALGGAFFQREFIAALQHEHRGIHDAPRLFFAADGIVLLFARKVRAAKRLPRTFPAQGRAVRQADDRAQLHERLAEIPRLGRIRRAEQFGKARAGRRLVDIRAVRVQAAQNAQNVAVHRGLRKSQRDGADRPRGIVAHPGKGAHAVKILRKSLRREDFRRLVQIAGAGVIPQPLPHFEHLFLARRGERLGRGKTLQKENVTLLDCLDARLLQHQLGDERRVETARLPPRKVAFANAVPLQQG